MHSGVVESGDRAELRSLTGLRIVAALWVLLLHLRTEILDFLPVLEPLRPFLTGGDLGVGVFFTLSGFVLSYQYLERLGPRADLRGSLRFLRLRIARVYPVHLLTLHLAVLLAFVAALRGQALTHADRTPLDYVENLFLVQAWFGQGISWNGPAWSVSAEWFAYLLFPLAALGIHRATRAHQLALGVLLPMVLAALVYSGALPYGPDADDLHALLRIAVAFTIGCFLYKVFRAVRPGRAVAAGLPVVSAVLLVASTYTPRLNPALELVPIGGLVLGLAYGAGPLSRLLASRPAVYGGAISYSLYMIHGLVFGVSRSLVLPRFAGASVPLRVLALAVVIGGSIGAAALLYHVVEEPARRWIRRRSPAERARVPA